MIAMLGTLAVLARLQYGWSLQIADVVQQRMRAGLVSSAARFQTELQRDLARICVIFDVPVAASRSEMRMLLWERAREWRRSGMPQGLVRRIHAVEGVAGRNWLAESLDAASGRYAAVPWPAAWTQLQQELNTNAGELNDPAARQWHLDPDAHVLFRAVGTRSVPSGRNPSAATRQRNETQSSLLAYVTVELDAAYLEHEYLPELAQRCFRDSIGQDFRVVVQVAGLRLYDSQPELPPLGMASADAVVDLLAPRRRQAPAATVSRTPRRPPASTVERTRFEQPAIRIAGKGVFQLLAQHRAGSLQAAVAAWRRSNLATSFGVLLVLAAGMAFLAIYAQRARSLAKLQMDFVANVSHELRTPVAAVCMMADNLADGVTDDPDRMRDYGRLLRVQGYRLRQMSEQVLMFAGNRKGAPKPGLRPASVAEAVAAAVMHQAPMIQAAGIALEQTIPDPLPPALADPVLLRTCIANLLDNAVKYGRSGGWIGLRAGVEAGPKPEVWISVEDRGPGIDAADRSRIFDPFYRGRLARDSQAPGTGLGLGLVRQAMESIGGRVSMESEPGQGCRFTLHLAACESIIVEKREAAGADRA